MSRRHIGWIVAACALFAGLIAGVFYKAGSSGPQMPESEHDYALTAVAVHNGVDRSIEAGLNPQDAIRFLYSVSGGAPERFVAIAGRDARGSLHWFHPRYDGPFQKPRSLAIEVGVTDLSLPPRRLTLPAGPMEICAMFTVQQADVTVIDGWFIAAQTWWPHGRRACVHITVNAAP